MTLEKYCYGGEIILKKEGNKNCFNHEAEKLKR